MSVESHQIRLRRIPYPYRAMLAICSDLDETIDGKTYEAIARYLNTTESTAMGEGVGLEVGNTIYFDMPQAQFSYWNTDDEGRSKIRMLIRSGHIDCLHSYGDLATTRAHAGRALEELSRHSCRLEVWVDHGVAPSNFGPDIMRGSGDVPGSIAYHADLTYSFGVQYVWLGRVTSVVGQGVPRSLSGIWNPLEPAASAKTIVKEFAKELMGGMGSLKYGMHRQNCLVRGTWLRDGHSVTEFMRANPHWGGVSCGDTADGLESVLTKSFLERLVQREGVCILYTHLGKKGKFDQPFSQGTRQALGLLASYRDDGKIMVTTTRRLLGYCRAINEINYAVKESAELLSIEIAHDCPRAELAGVSLYVPEVRRAKVKLNGLEITKLQQNPPDHTGQSCISLPWIPLYFPDL
jgi:hypothetical protein